MPIAPHTHDALKSLRQSLPQAGAALDLELGEAFSHWCSTLDRKVLPRLQPHMPLVAAICGGGSTGKSTLFNTLTGRQISAVGGRAGLNRRVLAAIPKGAHSPEAILDYFDHTFHGRPSPLENRSQLLTPGPPLYCESEIIPKGVVLLDTPDIDTGAKGEYTNRDLARQSLEVADLFIYIFTNATYNNLDNTDFISRMLTGMGMRPCYLVYRTYPSFSDDEIREHAATVSKNIYGTTRSDLVLGLFRADEDNAVAAGEKSMAIQRVDGPQAKLDEALALLEPESLRGQLLETMVDEALSQAKEMARKVADAKNHLDQYAQAISTAHNRCVQQALSHFPTDQVLRRFARIWLESDPAHIKVMRGTGKVIEWPMKTVIKIVRRIKDPKQTRKLPSSEEKLSGQLEMDLLSAANSLYKTSLDAKIPLGAQMVPAPAIVRDAQLSLEAKPWQATLETISTQKQRVLSWSNQLDADLKTLADELRQRMGLMDQIRQTFAAMLNVIPATAAITYILHTGDPVGAAGIKVKLTGLFGLQDLYALIAIPATAGMSKADRKQLEQMLAPLARTWLAHKLKVVRDLFEEEINGEVLERTRSAQKKADALVPEIERLLAEAGE